MKKKKIFYRLDQKRPLLLYHKQLFSIAINDSESCKKLFRKLLSRKHLSLVLIFKELKKKKKKKKN